MPLAFLSLATGLIQALGTTWGLFRHYRVMVKLTLTVFATALLLLHTRLVERLADLARATARTPEMHGLLVHLSVAAGGALLVLVTATVLSIYKPRGELGRNARLNAGPSRPS